MSRTLDALLARFEAARKPGPWAYRWAHAHDGGVHEEHVVITCLVHGNEVGSLPAVVRLQEALASGQATFGGRLTLVIANPEAARADRRFLDSDLNRAFAFVEGREGHEHARARELRPILDSADLLLDLHQTGTPSETAFWTYPWDPVLGKWARVLEATTVGITRAPGEGFDAPDLKCVDEYVRDLGRPAMCLELGEKGFHPTQEALAWRTMVRLLRTVDAIRAGTTTLEAEAHEHPELTWYTTVHREDWGSPDRALAPGLGCWSRVEAHQELAAEGSPSIQAVRTGRILFPKYPRPDEPRPTHLFHLVAPLHQHPDVAFSAMLGGDGGRMRIENVLSDMEADIASAEAEEALNHKLALHVREHLTERDGTVVDEDVTRAVQFVTDYIRSIPTILREALERSEGTFAEDKMRRMVTAATTYWQADDDVIPDSEGLYGILDDAYCTLILVQALDERYREQTGQGLVAADLTESNLAIRRLLGPTNAGQLEDYVDEALDDATMTELLESLQADPMAPPPERIKTNDELILQLFNVI
ncbi:MAG: succinylglutamate desuccinylase/aspartoacylase family protein [Myxococcales bacterium]|nr:succinylglutamate desuccinylase/aspartoacylase family protein [Myxococcales bacterium]MCB9668397.1 succinylglutamate desuccinylase/aspartoacylase family protein [Alphaproteobacteria bacterium]MCB9690635.1 succinylglutamate desuccinylase/aspartoacylase family protein [Alphaproteobacteria bacterium]